MRGAFIGDAYIEKLGRVHIFHDTDSTRHFYYLAISSDRQGRINRANVVFVKTKRRKSEDSPAQD